MSNIHAPSAHHGIDDEFNYGQSNRCTTCWSAAKKAFFTPARRPRRGATLARLYADLHEESHGQGNRS